MECMFLNTWSSMPCISYHSFPLSSPYPKYCDTTPSWAKLGNIPVKDKFINPNASKTIPDMNICNNHEQYCYKPYHKPCQKHHKPKQTKQHTQYNSF